MSDSDTTRMVPVICVLPERTLERAQPYVDMSLAAIGKNPAVLTLCEKNGWQPEFLIYGALLANMIEDTTLPLPGSPE